MTKKPRKLMSGDRFTGFLMIYTVAVVLLSSGAMYLALNGMVTIPFVVIVLGVNFWVPWFSVWIYKEVGHAYMTTRKSCD